ncbi:hypothetical protein KBX53_10950 [Micromonospora sp. M51]|uniref:hypothetical protein n=1 Tax=Micromonospora TaxID=1873 RepID=UPI0009E072F9|nr:MULTISPECIES: hypothetical protein [Micromonospora]MBQ1011458.1 hypothetical protein [Micromonospora sp. M51]
MAKNRPPFSMKAMLRLERGTATATDALRRYAPLADELGADGIDVACFVPPSTTTPTRAGADVRSPPSATCLPC